MSQESPCSDIYMLYYRKGGVLTEMPFKGNGRNRDEAIKKAREFCEQRGLVFCHLYDWLKDIDELLDNGRES